MNLIQLLCSEDAAVDPFYARESEVVYKKGYRGS